MTIICVMCSLASTKTCAGCKSIRYCSEECQAADWTVHKLLCRTFKDFCTRPIESAKRAILFPQDSKAPSWVWIETKILSDEFDSRYEVVELKNLLGRDNPLKDRRLVQRNSMRARDLKKTLEVVVRDAFLGDGSQPNRSLVEATRGALAHDWRGPAVVLAKRGISPDPPFYGDVDISDFRDVADYFTTYGDNSVAESSEDGKRDEMKVTGVRINCDADMKVFGKKKFVAVDVPREHPVFLGVPCGISKRVGQPVLVRKCPPDRAWKDDNNANLSNQAATFLHLNDDPNHDDSHGIKNGVLGWGLASMQWQNDVGSVIVVSSEGKDLLRSDIEVLCHFCQHKMGPLFEASHEGRITREEVLMEMTPAKYRRFVAESYQQQVSDDASTLAPSDSVSVGGF